MIQFTGASRWYGQVIGLNDVTCSIGPGITALLGQNGAGKSTMLRLISGQLRPTTGEVEVFGMEPFANAEVYRKLGYCPEIDNFYEWMNGYQFVEHMARMSGLGASHARSRSREIIEFVGMADRAKRKIAGYSKGMRQRIKLAQALIHDPQAILLDEPLNGLDPVGRHEFMGLLSRFADQGRTILVSSHILFEVEQMTRNIVILHRGRLLASGSIRDIRELIDRYPHRIQVNTPQGREVASLVTRFPSVLQVTLNREGVEVQTRQPGEFYSALPGLVLEQGLQIEGFTSPDNNLESVYQYLVNS